ncbi:hypothetical protein V8C86DRAFT_2822893, partial [Haematococcus lacustris]
SYLFRGKVVMLVGASNSGEDISREVSQVAMRVLLSSRSWMDPEWAWQTCAYGPAANIYRKQMVCEFTAEGLACFPDGSVERVDTVVWCTGYSFAFPFLLPPLMARLDGSHAVPAMSGMVVDIGAQGQGQGQ